MIKVDKDLNAIPVSLRVDEVSLRKNPAKTTHMRRMEVINDGCYPSVNNSVNHDKRYKYKDIKDSLEALYHCKCAFCETKSEQMHVEHYRPKRGGYYWLAYSWANLLLCCPTCNINKGDDFPLAEGGVRVSFNNTDEDIQRINTLSLDYDETECPLLLNPETATNEELTSLNFTQDGAVSSANPRMMQTIQNCKLTRKALCENRKLIWDKLRNNIRIAGALYDIESIEFKAVLKVVLKNFQSELQNKNTDYVAFRNYVLTSDWIQKEILSL